MKTRLGGKGAYLAGMAARGFPVPPGFTIPVEGKDYTNIPEILLENSAWLKTKVPSGGQFLVSVRSGAAVSMPGMMDTVLNLGMNEDVVAAMPDKRFAWDCYRRFIYMFSDVVKSLDMAPFSRIQGMDGADWEPKARLMMDEYRTQTGESFPTDMQEQMRAAVDAVYESFYNDRAVFYRRHHKLDCPGTAVNIQLMVFGNQDQQSGTGVLFSRNPSTGAKELFGEFLHCAQGEDVVAGTHTPVKVQAIKLDSPALYNEISQLAERLEAEFKDVQDVEFTVCSGKLYVLQTRSAKRSGLAAITIALDLLEEGLVSRQRAVQLVSPEHMAMVLHSSIDAAAAGPHIAKGVGASPGAANGLFVTDTRRAIELAKAGVKVVLVREETSAEDVEGMALSQGVITKKGGQTSHAAVVARGMGIPCIVACDISLQGNDEIEGSMDGHSGCVYRGVPTHAWRAADIDNPVLRSFISLIKATAPDAKVYTNAENFIDATTADKLGAYGIGLARTEHMFLETSRLAQLRNYIMGNDTKAALGRMKSFQCEDLCGLFKVFNGRPVLIRLLDPPLHEFMPKLSELTSEAEIARYHALHESNPMLGNRGVRLGLTTELYDMQVEAIHEAVKLSLAAGVSAHPHIMIPLIMTHREMEVARDKIRRIAGDAYPIGTMIETPRAALLADTVAHLVDFVSFGTNDLTQMTLGISRDDAASFLGVYRDLGIMDFDPFQTIDQVGVGALVKMACDKLRSAPSTRVKSIGICGEHGGEPESIRFLQRTCGLSYVSCSPFRVPVALLVLAQEIISKQQHA